MPNYTYTARDMQGSPQQGIIHAESDADLRDRLRTNGLYLVRFRKTYDASERKRSTSFGQRRIKLQDVVVLSRQFATLVRSGVPIVETLGTLRAQTDHPVIVDALNQIQTDVLEGMSLSQALSRHPNIFNAFYVCLVAAGEAAGTLDRSLEIIAEQLDKEAVIQEQVRSAMTYPKLVVMACVGVVAFMLVFIVPTFTKVYDQFNADLPFMTLFLVSVSDVVTKMWWIVLIGIFVAFRAFGAFKRTTAGKRMIDATSLKLPLLGPVLRKIAISRFTQTLSSITQSGVPILNGLAISADTSGNAVIREAVLKVATQVSEGAPIAATLDQTGQFPAMVTRMIAAGEKSGNLEEMLSEVTKFYQRDVDYSVQRMTKMIEPLMTIAVGSIVLVVLLALYMPIFNLSNVIKK